MLNSEKKYILTLVLSEKKILNETKNHNPPFKFNDRTLRYIIIETNEFSPIGYYGILFPHSYSGDGLAATHLGLHLSTHAEKETRYIQYGPLLLFQ